MRHVYSDPFMRHKQLHANGIMEELQRDRIHAQQAAMCERYGQMFDRLRKERGMA